MCPWHPVRPGGPADHPGLTVEENLQLAQIAPSKGWDIEVLLLDEPYQGPAPVIVHEIARTRAIIREQGITTILVGQNAVAALRLADRTVILDTGPVVYDGTAREILDDAAPRAEYLAM